MVPIIKDSHRYQRIGNPFSRPLMSPLMPLGLDIKDNWEGQETKQASDWNHSIHLGSSPTTSPGTPPEEGQVRTMVDETPNSRYPKPRTLQKVRSGSVFGSLGKKPFNPAKEQSPDSVSTATSGAGCGFEQSHHSKGKNVLHHGEVQTTSGLFRKRKEYLVLTETHLVRFKSHSRASEVFSSITTSVGRSGTTRHPSTASVGSLPDLQSLNSHASSEADNAIPLKQIVTAYKVEDGRPFFTTEVVYLDEECNFVGSIQLMLSDPKEADLWHTSIRGAAQKARLVAGEAYTERIVHYLVHVLETSLDYDEAHFQIFRVVRRAVNKGPGRLSSDDLAKMSTSVSYMVIGINQLHLISLPDFGDQSLRMFDAKANKISFGLVTLISMDVQHADDTFQLGFRKPFEIPVVLELAASSSPEIATVIFNAILYLKPQWLDYTFLFSGPRGLLDDNELTNLGEHDNGCFDRTLIAYCAAYKCNAGNIQYAIDLESEDAPEFRLMPPATTSNYNVLELLSVFRALRYNESFRSISFDSINLQNLHSLFDTSGDDHLAWTSRSGLPIQKYFGIMPADKSLLYQEVQALALKAKRVRRMNFRNTLPRRRPRDDVEEGAVKDPGCEIAAALLPLCRGQLTNVDWIIFSGIDLGETDLEEFVLALGERQCHFRCLDVSRCALNDRGLQVFLNHLEKQNATMECISIADNPGRIHLARFPITMSRFSQIRKLDLSRVTSTCGTEPLIAPEVMLSWRLEELIMTGVPINDKTLDAISTYIASSMSDCLHRIQMDQCNLTGAHVAILMRSMSRVTGEARNLHLVVSANRLEKGHGEIVKAIEENQTPKQLTMRMVEYETETRFRQLLQALQKNSTIQSLDISKASLPDDAGDETCEALRILFEENQTLQELDISGEHAHLEIARFGIGLNAALYGLRKNKALKVLRIEYQNLGLEGANTLASVLEENETLTHIYCDHNEITLQAFTVLVNAMARNLTILSLPGMAHDQNEAAKRMTAAIGGSNSTNLKEGVVKHSVRRTLNTLGVHRKEKDSSHPSPQDVEQAVQILNSRWYRQTERLMEFISRNQDLAAGLESREKFQSFDALRPGTALSDSGILEDVLSNATPRRQRPNPIDTAVETHQTLGENHENESSTKGDCSEPKPISKWQL